jgi:ferredoxin-NADP reductase
VRTVQLTRVDAASTRQRLLTVDLGGKALAYLPGQAVWVAPHGGGDRRLYSIACSPERAAETGTIQLLIALEGGPEDLPWAVPGSRIDLDGPVGTFTFPASLDHPRVLFVAGGTGIAPVRSMLDHALRHHPARRFALLYSARRSDEFAFVDELRAHARAGRLELHQTVTRDDDGSWEGRRGRIGLDHFQVVLHDPAATLCFVCGPPSLVSDSVATLRTLGVPTEAVRAEGWALGRDE